MTVYEVSGCVALAAPLLVSYAVQSKWKKEQQQRDTLAREKAARASVLEAIRGQMRAWHQEYTAAVQQRNALAAKLQDPQEAFEGMFEGEALRDPSSTPGPTRREVLQSQYNAFAQQVDMLHRKGEELKADYSNLEMEATGVGGVAHHHTEAS